jgi:hypothetical protein
VERPPEGARFIADRLPAVNRRMFAFLSAACNFRGRAGGAKHDE